MINNNQLHIQTTKSKGTMLELIKQAASTFKYDKLTVIVAYASKLGCNVLVESLKDVTQNWDNIDKKWIIYPCTHNNICEKDALERGLRSMSEMVEPLTESSIKDKFK